MVKESNSKLRQTVGFIAVLFIVFLYLALYELDGLNYSRRRRMKQRTLVEDGGLKISEKDDPSRLRRVKLVKHRSSPSLSEGPLTHSGHNDSLPPCPERPSTLQGFVNVTLKHPPSFEEIGRLHEDIQELGGHYKPPNCTSKDKVAIIIPYREREKHLRLFLFNMLPFLKRQQLDFTIYVIEQGENSKGKILPFNRAMLFNVGFVEANKRGDYDCFIFHDVDLIPENDNNLYNCPLQPTHMTVALDRYNWTLPYKAIFGGVTAFTKSQFLEVNGYSNSYWGWGAEDDDAYGRVIFHGFNVSRPSPDVARYRNLAHSKQTSKASKENMRLFKKRSDRYKTDGLNSLKYSLEEVALKKTFTLVKARLEKGRMKKRVQSLPSSTPNFTIDASDFFY